MTHATAPWDNDAFLVLMRVAQETPAVRDQLAYIVGLPGAERRALLEPWIAGLREGGTPAGFAEAIESLRHDAFAAAVARFLAGE